MTADIIRMTEDYCPECGHILDAAQSLNETRSPVVGDLSICAHCAAYLEYGPDLKLMRMSKEALDDFTADELFAFTQERKKILEFIEWKKICLKYMIK